MPSPTETELRVHDSPVPTHTLLGFDGSIVIAPIDCTLALSNTGLKVVPPSIDFQTPPDAAPTKIVVLPFTFMPVTAAMRPLIVADPMLRMPRPETTPESATTGAALFGRGATAFDAGAGPLGGRIVRASFVPAAGKRKSASSRGTFASARSIVKRADRGRPGLPDSTENGK